MLQPASSILSSKASLLRCTGARRRFSSLPSLDTVTSWARARGIAWPSASLYGGFGAGYDYGPLGTALKRRISDAWWRDFVSGRRDCVGIDAALLSSPRALAASGHVARFTDPMAACAKCGRRVRCVERQRRWTRGCACAMATARCPTSCHPYCLLN